MQSLKCSIDLLQLWNPKIGKQQNFILSEVGIKKSVPCVCLCVLDNIVFLVKMISIHKFEGNKIQFNTQSNDKAKKKNMCVSGYPTYPNFSQRP